MTEPDAEGESKEEGLGESKEADLLMAKYGLVRTELMQYMANYKANVKYMNYMVVGVLAVFSLSIRAGPGFYITESRLFWLVFYFSITTLVGYISFDLLESQYSLKALASRAESLEKEINKIAHKKLLVWETELAGKFFQARFVVNSVINPSSILPIYWGVFAGSALMIPPVFMILKFWENPQYTFRAFWFQAATIGLAAYALLTVVFIVGCALTIFLRMGDRARYVVESVSRQSPK